MQNWFRRDPGVLNYHVTISNCNMSTVVELAKLVARRHEAEAGNPACTSAVHLGLDHIPKFFTLYVSVMGCCWCVKITK